MLGNAAAGLREKRRCDDGDQDVDTQHSSSKNWNESLWIKKGYWSVCPHCGRRRPNGKIELGWAATFNRSKAGHACANGCDLEPHALEAPKAEAASRGLVRMSSKDVNQKKA